MVVILGQINQSCSEAANKRAPEAPLFTVWFHPISHIAPVRSPRTLARRLLGKGVQGRVLRRPGARQLVRLRNGLRPGYGWKYQIGRNDLSPFQGRVALVTGGAQGIGLAISRQLFSQGANVFMADLQAEKVAAAANTLDPSGARTASCSVDVRSEASVRSMVDAAVARFAKLHYLVNVAGGSGTVPADTIEDMSEEIWDRVIGANLKGTYLCCRAAVPHMKASGGGGILNFATGSLAGAAGKSTMTARLAYVAAKAGIVGFTNQLARDLEELGISANAIMPGFTLTEPGARIYEQFHKLSPQDREAMLKRMKIPPRSAEEIGFASSAILAQGAANLTGCVVRVAGGKMESPDLKFTDEGQTPLGRGVRIEPK